MIDSKYFYIVSFLIIGSVQFVLSQFIVSRFESSFLLAYALTIYISMGLLLILVYLYRKNKLPLLSLLVPFKDKNIIKAGMFNSLMIIFSIYSANPLRTPPFIQAVLNSGSIVLSVLFTKYILKKENNYDMKYIIPSLVFLCCSVFISLSIYLYSFNFHYINFIWTFVFLFSILFKTLYSIYLEKYLLEKKSADNLIKPLTIPLTSLKNSDDKCINLSKDLSINSDDFTQLGDKKLTNSPKMPRLSRDLSESIIDLTDVSSKIIRRTNSQNQLLKIEVSDNILKIENAFYTILYRIPFMLPFFPIELYTGSGNILTDFVNSLTRMYTNIFDLFLFHIFILLAIVYFILLVHVTHISANYNIIISTAISPLGSLFFILFPSINPGANFPWYVVLSSFMCNIVSVILWIKGENKKE